jgi:hypothetical protein
MFIAVTTSFFRNEHIGFDGLAKKGAVFNFIYRVVYAACLAAAGGILAYFGFRYNALTGNVPLRHKPSHRAFHVARHRRGRGLDRPGLASPDPRFRGTGRGRKGMNTLLLYLALFGILFALGAPVVLSLAASAVAMLLLRGVDLLVFAQKFMVSMDNYSLTAMLFFILAGEIIKAAAGPPYVAASPAW